MTSSHAAGETTTNSDGDASRRQRACNCRPRHPCVVLVMVEDKAMSAHEFRDDDAGYLAWLNTHPDGFVLNIGRSHHATAARVHHASCRTISGANPRGGLWTGPYVKVARNIWPSSSSGRSTKWG